MIEMKIPVYVINLKERIDRLTSILAEFKDKNDYTVRIKEAIKHENGGVGLWLTIREIVKDAIQQDFDHIIICEDDHVFTEYYEYSKLERAIEKSNLFELDVLL